MEDIDFSKVRSRSLKLPPPPLEDYQKFKQNKPKRRAKKGSRLVSNDSIEDCLDNYPEQNPFLDPIWNEKQGEFQVPTVYSKDENGRDYTYESAPFARVYMDGSCKKMVTKLPNSALALLFWIILNQHRKGWVFLNESRVRKEMAEMKNDKTFTKAMKILIDAGIIEEYYKPYYLINPRITHYGSRTRSFPNFLSKRSSPVVERNTIEPGQKEVDDDELIF